MQLVRAAEAPPPPHTHTHAHTPPPPPFVVLSQSRSLVPSRKAHANARLLAARFTEPARRATQPLRAVLRKGLLAIALLQVDLYLVHWPGVHVGQQPSATAGAADAADGARLRVWREMEAMLQAVRPRARAR